MMIITYGSASKDLARSVGSLTGFPVVETVCRRFPDGEQLVKVQGDVRSEDVALIQTTALDPDSRLMEYALIVDALKGAGCRSVTGVIPYMAYARQDSRFHPGEPLSAKLFARLIEAPGTDRLFTVDMHLHRLREIQDVFQIPAVNLSAMPLLADYYREHFGSGKVMVTGPDAESGQWARLVADRLSVSCTILQKERAGDREVSVTGNLTSAGCRVVLVDDIVSTGRTLIEVISKLRHGGAERIDALVTHPLLMGDALDELKKAGLGELITTDTVPGRSATVSIAPLLAEALSR
jgi:ribose-phosphate pyrophosphokinase